MGRINCDDDGNFNGTPPPPEGLGHLISEQWKQMAEFHKKSQAPKPLVGYKCSVCAHVYDAAADGDGAAFEDLPDSWVCPVCGQPKSVYTASRAAPLTDYT